MRASVSRVVEIFHRGDGEPVEVYPRFCIDEGMITAKGAPCLSDGITLREQMKRKPDSTICFYRTYALGDLLILTPIFNWLKDEYPACQIYLATSTGYLGLFKYWDVVTTVGKRNMLSVDYDVGYYLDGIVEKDHLGGSQSYKHRLDLYCEFLGIDVPKEPIFSLPYGEDEKQWADGVVGAFREPGKPVVAMQVFGSTNIKRFSLGKVIKIAEELIDSCSLIFVHDMKELIGVDGAMDMTGLTSIHQLAALIDASDLVITMDSGVLWIAHCTMTPVIALLGPTREQERLRYHRNYHVVNLAEMVDCEPCFERMTRCAGNASCLVDADEKGVAKRIKDGIRRLVYQ